MNRYTFLANLHKVVRPKVYLEVGVQFGTSLEIARDAEVAIGVDPNPLCKPQGNQVIFGMTSDYYFMHHGDDVRAPIDMAFIDGMHLYEYALRDFINIEARSARSSVIIFDDVLPYNQAIAGREQPPGDWTGDVWKVYYLLKWHRPDLDLTLVDIFPTGALVVTDLDPGNTKLQVTPTAWEVGDIVPGEILMREKAITGAAAVELVRERSQQ